MADLTIDQLTESVITVGADVASPKSRAWCSLRTGVGPVDDIVVDLAEAHCAT